MRVDLHIHTNASDGAWAPAKVVERAAAGGLNVIAIADHDTTAAVSSAVAAGVTQDVQVIPALEVSSSWEGREIHVLGYGVDLGSVELAEYTLRAARLRDERMAEIVRRLGAQGIEVTFQQVEEEAGPDRVNIGRPHLARVLVEEGHASSVPDAFNRLIGDRHPAFVPTGLLDPAEAVRLVVASGGIPIWAHPPGDLVDTLLPQLVRAGLRGLEVYRPSHGRGDVMRLEGMCTSAKLLRSGGSDWHTPDSGNVLGDFYVTGDEIADLLTELGI